MYDLGYDPEVFGRNRLSGLIARSGMPKVTVHSLRHTYATAAIHSGDDIKTVPGNLGHATAAFTLDIYGHLTD